MPPEYLKLIFRNVGCLVGLRHQLREETSRSFDFVFHVTSFLCYLKWVKTQKETGNGVGNTASRQSSDYKITATGLFRNWLINWKSGYAPSRRAGEKFKVGGRSLLLTKKTNTSLRLHVALLQVQSTITRLSLWDFHYVEKSQRTRPRTL